MAIAKGYRLFDETTQTIKKRRDVIFNESVFDLDKVKTKQVVVGVSPEVEEKLPANEPLTDELQPQPQPQEPRRSGRQRNQPMRYGFNEFADTAKVDHVAYNVCQITEPVTIEEALASENATEWKAAADSEYESLMENETWKLTELPKDRDAIGCKWVFKVKYTSDGKVERFKARLVAKGYAQRYHVDYDETFSPVVRFSSIRALLAFAVQNNMLVHQMDAVTAFLNGTLDEEIYMQQPTGYIMPNNEHLVCKLKKSLYGLKQSPRCWNKAFCEYIETVGFCQSAADPCVFVRIVDTLAIVAVYVDDLILISATSEGMENVKKSLADRFKMKDMGPLHYCLGVSIIQEDGRILLHQKQYILNMVKRYGLAEAHPVSTPADINVNLVKDDGISKDVDPVKYQSMVGSLLYAAMATRPDIAHAVGAVSKFNSRPSAAHLTAVKRIYDI